MFCFDDREPGEPPTARERILRALSRLGPDETAVVALIAERLVEGRQAYGELHLETDRRDFEAETLDECADGLAYAAMGLIRRRRQSDADERSWRGTGPGRAGNGTPRGSNERNS